MSIRTAPNPPDRKNGRTLARKQLKEAEERLIRSGFAREQIESQVKIASGISAAIREEAERGNYDSVLIGRRGLGAMGNMFFGSTSGELIEKCHKVPLWIVDGNVNASRFLLAVQSHPSSLMAADHLAFMLKDHPGAEICLYHSNAVFGSSSRPRPKISMANGANPGAINTLTWKIFSFTPTPNCWSTTASPGTASPSCPPRCIST